VVEGDVKYGLAEFYKPVSFTDVQVGWSYFPSVPKPVGGVGHNKWIYRAGNGKGARLATTSPFSGFAYGSLTSYTVGWKCPLASGKCR
jgi:hypothetical protein